MDERNEQCITAMSMALSFAHAAVTNRNAGFVDASKHMQVKAKEKASLAVAIIRGGTVAPDVFIMVRRYAYQIGLVVNAASGPMYFHSEAMREYERAKGAFNDARRVLRPTSKY